MELERAELRGRCRSLFSSTRLFPAESGGALPRLLLRSPCDAVWVEDSVRAGHRTRVFDGSFPVTAALAPSGWLEESFSSALSGVRESARSSFASRYGGLTHFVAPRTVDPRPSGPSDPSRSSWRRELEFHATMLRVLAACCSRGERVGDSPGEQLEDGTRFHAEAVSLAQSVLDLSTAVDLATRFSCPSFFRAALLRFIREVYLASPVVERRAPGPGTGAALFQLLDFGCLRRSSPVHSIPTLVRLIEDANVSRRRGSPQAQEGAMDGFDGILVELMPWQVRDSAATAEEAERGDVSSMVGSSVSEQIRSIRNLVLAREQLELILGELVPCLQLLLRDTELRGILTAEPEFGFERLQASLEPARSILAFNRSRSPPAELCRMRFAFSEFMSFLASVRREALAPRVETAPISSLALRLGLRPDVEDVRSADKIEDVDGADRSLLQSLFSLPDVDSAPSAHGWSW